MLFRPIGGADEPVTPQLQLVDAVGQVSTLATEFTALSGQRKPLVRPSDVCVDEHGGFYVTDGGRVAGRSRSITGLLYGTYDGEIREVVYPLEMPNGIALSPDGSKVYVAETRTRRIWEFEIAEPGRVGRARGLATVPSGGPLNVGGADGLCVDADGRILVATLGAGGLTVFSPDGELLGAITADDPMTTNLTLSPDGSTLFMTLASTGCLIAIDEWLGEIEVGVRRPEAEARQALWATPTGRSVLLMGHLFGQVGQECVVADATVVGHHRVVVVLRRLPAVGPPPRVGRA